MPDTCECDRYRHAEQTCRMPPADIGSVVSSAALCTGCLFVCWSGDDDGKDSI